MSNEVTIGLIGCGGMMCQGHIKTGYKPLWEANRREFRITAACDVRRENAEAAAAQVAEFQGTKPAVYTDFRAMLEKERGLDAVDISVVHNEHHTVAIPCLEAGKHVTIEKPLGITCRAARAIIAAAKKARRALQTAENYRYKPDERAIRWAVKSGRIGELRQLYWVEVRERAWHWGWREDRDLAGGGWTMDGGVHYADLFRYHVGDIVSLYAVSKQYSPTRFRNREKMSDPVKVTVEDTTMAVLTFANGVSGTWVSTNVAPGDGMRHSAIYGSEGSLVWGKGLKNRKEEVPIQDLIKAHQATLSEEQKEKLFPGGVQHSCGSELWEFVQAVQGRSSLETGGVEGLQALAVCMAVYESAHLGQAVEIAKVENLEIENYQRDLNQAGGLA